MNKQIAERVEVTCPQCGESRVVNKRSSYGVCLKCHNGKKRDYSYVGTVVGSQKCIALTNPDGTSPMIVVQCIDCGHIKNIRRYDHSRSKGLCFNCSGREK
jgi:ribosomal protein S27E